MGVQVYFKGHNVIRNLLVAPKDRDKMTQKNGVIYRFICALAGCEEHIGKSARTFWGKIQGTSQGPSPMYDHGNTSGHCISVDSFPIVGREVCSITRTIKEAMYFRVNDQSLNRNIGKFQLPQIWDGVLQGPCSPYQVIPLLLVPKNQPYPLSIIRN